MNVSLTPELDAFVEAKVASGRYGSASEVVGEALRLMEEHEDGRARELARFQREIQRRLDSLDRGEGIPAEEAKAQMREFFARRRQQPQ